MLESKSYVIGLIEIDPVTDSPESWVTLAGDDETLEAVLARLAGRRARDASPGDAAGLEPAFSGPALFGAGGRQARPAAGLSWPQQVAANLAGLRSDLSVRLAEVLSRLDESKA